MWWAEVNQGQQRAVVFLDLAISLGWRLQDGNPSLFLVFELEVSSSPSHG